jgi:hypothetical protein
LRVQAQRTVEQEAMVSQVNTHERGAKLILKKLYAHGSVERHSLIMGRTFLRIGYMLLRRAITADEDAL